LVSILPVWQSYELLVLLIMVNTQNNRTVKSMVSSMKIIQGTPVDNSDFIAEVPTYMGAASLRLFAMGFLEMAEISSERAVQNKCSIDAVIPATLYALRHSVELFLKYAVYDLRVVEEDQSVSGHPVGDIFATHKPMLEIALECEPDSGFGWRDWLRRFESLVQAVHEIDPNGQAIRYPADIKLVPNQGGGYTLSTKHLESCLASVRSLYHEYDERNC